MEPKHVILISLTARILTHIGTVQITTSEIPNIMINTTIPNLRKILTFATVLQSIIDQRQQQFSTNLFGSVFLVYDSATIPFSPIVRAVHNNVGIPMVISEFHQVPRKFITRQEHDENHLYVFLFSNITNFRRIDDIKASFLDTSSPKVVFLLDTSDSMDVVVEHANAELYRLGRYVLFRADGQVFLHLSDRIQKLFTADLENETRATCCRIRQSVQAEQDISNVDIFLHYRAYHCIAPIGDASGNLELIGIDVMMAHAVARQMQRTPILNTDAKLVDPQFSLGKYEEVSIYTEEKKSVLDYQRMRNFEPSFVFDFNV